MPSTPNPSRSGPAADRGGLLVAGLAALAALILYAATACRTIHVGDSAELAAAASCFGVPHPPGYPLYTLLTGLWVHLFPPDRHALAANLASALHAAGAAGLLVLLLRGARLSSLAALAAAALFAVSRSVWAQAVAAEVYAFDLLLLAGAILALARAMRRADRAASVLAGLILGLWLGHRFLNLLYLPAIWLLARHAAPARASRPAGPRTAVGRQSLAAGALFVLGLAASALVYLYLPLAGRAEPAIYIGDPQTWDRFLAVVRGTPYLRHVEGTTPALALLRLGDYARALPREVGIGLLLAAVGLIRARTLPAPEKRLVGGALCLLAANLAVIAAYNIMDIASYRPPGVLALCLLAGVGVETTLRRVGSLAPVRRTAMGWMIVLLCLAPVPWNYAANDLSREDAALRYGEQLLDSVPGDALLLTQGDTRTHILWYLQAVERRSPETLIVSTGHATAWYVAQLARRHPRASLPTYRDGEPWAGFYRRLLESAGARRPVCFAFDPGQLATLTAGPWWGERTIVPAGLALSARRKAVPFDRDSLYAENAELWTRFRREMPRVSPAADIEAQALGLEYVLAMIRTAEFFERGDRIEDARDLYGAVAAMRPGGWEGDLREAYRRIGRVIPPLGLEERARRALERTQPERGATP